MRRSIIAGAALTNVASAWVVDLTPKQTNVAGMKELGDVEGWSPVPTPAPGRRDLVQRQAATQILGYVSATAFGIYICWLLM